jgi:hypothetical protein
VSVLRLCGPVLCLVVLGMCIYTSLSFRDFPLPLRLLYMPLKARLLVSSIRLAQLTDFGLCVAEKIFESSNIAAPWISAVDAVPLVSLTEEPSLVKDKLLV